MYYWFRSDCTKPEHVALSAVFASALLLCPAVFGQRPNRGTVERTNVRPADQILGRGRVIWDFSTPSTRTANPTLGKGRITQTFPQPGAQGVVLDRSTSIFFDIPLDPSTLNDQSIFVTSGTTTLTTELQLSENHMVVTIDYSFFLPEDATVQVTIDGDLLMSRFGNPLDVDADSQPGGVASFVFHTGPGVPLPMPPDSATIIGYVFDTKGNPLRDAFVQGWFYPRTEGQPPIGVAPGLTDAQGFFQYQTVPFAGQETFLLEIRATDHSESLRRVTVLAGGCWRVEDSYLQPLTPPTFVQPNMGGQLMDQTGNVTLDIPPGALQSMSNIGVTTLDSSQFLREELPPLVAEQGVFVDVSGVSGDETNIPVALRLPNTYDLPVGTRVPFGKVDHNTLQWSDLRDLYTGPPPVPDEFMGIVKMGGARGTFIEVQFDNFCSICTGYCLPFPPGILDNNSGGPDTGDPSLDGPGICPGNSVVSLREGFLRETIELPTLREFGSEFGVALGYYSGAASPSVTLSAQVNYNSTRPVEATRMKLDIEGVALEALYGRTLNNQKPIGTFFWNGRNGVGELLPTGSYPYSLQTISLNSEVPISLPARFGEVGTPVFTAGTKGSVAASSYAGLTPLRSNKVEERAVLVNLRESPYGAGWSLINEPQLHFDADGCVVLLTDSDWRLFEPDPGTANLWVSPAGEFTTLVFNPATGGFVQSFEDGSTQVFGASGRIELRLDRYGNETRYSYTGDLLTRITSPTGYEFTIFYDAFGKLTRIEDSAQRETHFVVDGSGNLVSVTDPAGHTRQFQYDAEHRLVSQTGSRGERTEYTYKNGRVVGTRSYDTDGLTLLRRRSFEPSALVGEATAAAAVGIGTTLTRPIQPVLDQIDVVIDGRGARSLFETNKLGETITVTDRLGRTTDYTYDEQRQLSSVFLANGSSHRFLYDSSGNLTTQQDFDALGSFYSATQFEYSGGNAFDQLTRFADAAGKETRLLYDNFGNLISITDHLGGDTRIEYEHPTYRNLITAMIGPTGNRSQWTYDSHGNVLTATTFPDPAGAPLGLTSRLTYDTAGNPTSQVTPEGRVTTYTYDENNRATQFFDATGQRTSFSYDAACGCDSNNMTKVVLPNNSTITYRYDGLNRLVEWVDQFGKVTTREYDPENNIVSYRDRNGELLTYRYDAEGQLVRKDVPRYETTFYDYDESGNLISAADPGCQLMFGYDFLGQLTEAVTYLDLTVGTDHSVPFTHSINYAYDRMGNRLTAFDGTGVVDRTYEYDDLHRLISLSLPSPDGEVWDFGYDEVGRRLTTARRSKGLATQYSYDATQLLSIEHPTSPPIAFHYNEYDSDRNVLERTLHDGAPPLVSTFNYDGRAQLVRTLESRRYGDARVTKAYTYDAANRLTSDSDYTYSYDDEGRLISRVRLDSPVTDSYEYDAEGHLRLYTQSIEIEGSNVVVLTVSYAYDPRGRRISKEVNGVVTRYVYDEEDILHEIDAMSRLDRSYIHGPGLDEPLALHDWVTGDTEVYVADRLGTIVALSDPDGNVRQRYDYDEFGNVVSESYPLSGQPYSFTGRERDFETGFYLLRNRYYIPSIGRFAREDTLSLAGGLNVYSYANSNPVNAADPLGLRTCRVYVSSVFFVHGYLEIGDDRVDLQPRSFLGPIPNPFAPITIRNNPEDLTNRWFEWDRVCMDTTPDEETRLLQFIENKFDRPRERPRGPVLPRNPSYLRYHCLDFVEEIWAVAHRMQRGWVPPLPRR